MDRLFKLAATAAAIASALGAPSATAQDCERHMLTGVGFGFDGVTGPLNYPRVGITWDPDGPGPLAEVAVIAGQFNIPGLNIVTWDGRQYAPLGEGLGGIVRALAVIDGQLIAGGEFQVSGASVPISRLAAWNGTSWETFAGGADGTVYALHIHNNELYAGGEFATIGGQSIPRLARWDGSQWNAVGGLFSFTDTTVRTLETHEGRPRRHRPPSRRRPPVRPRRHQLHRTHRRRRRVPLRRPAHAHRHRRVGRSTLAPLWARPRFDHPEIQQRPPHD